MAGPGGSKLFLPGFPQNLSKMLCRRGAGSGASRIFVFHSFSPGLRVFLGVGEGLGCQGSSQPVLCAPASSTSWGWQSWQIRPQQLLGILQCCQSWKALEAAPKPVQEGQCWVLATGVASQSHRSAPTSTISKCTFFFLKLLILNKTVINPPDSSSWSFWSAFETSKEEKTLG